MKVGDLVRRRNYHSDIGLVLNSRIPGPELRTECRPAFQRLVEVLWLHWPAQEVWSNQLEVISESR